MSDEDVVPLQGETEDAGFDVVLRGYDRRQVDDYVHRVEVTLADADRLHREDGDRLTALEDKVLALQGELADAERRASGLPEPVSQAGDRIATMLRLAEEEADELVAHARERAEKSLKERLAALEAREADVAGAGLEADRLRMEAQTDATALRDRARAEADDLLRQARAEADQLLAAAAQESEQRLRTAEEDVSILHEDARRQAAALVDEAQRQGQAMVDEAQREADGISRQRDAIAAQLDDLRRRLSDAMKPMGEA